MNERVQIITTPGGERLVLMSEIQYEALLAAAEDDEELRPEFLEEIRRRRAAMDAGEPVVTLEEILAKKR